MRTQKSLNIMGYSTNNVCYFDYTYKEAIKAGKKLSHPLEHRRGSDTYRKWINRQDRRKSNPNQLTK